LEHSETKEPYENEVFYYSEHPCIEVSHWSILKQNNNMNSKIAVAGAE